MRKTYIGILTSLPANGIFTFGSNPEGRHGKGSALYAVKHFGAVYGQGYGRQGQSYAIATKDLRKYSHPSISVGEIVRQIVELYEYATINPELDFYIAYSGTGKNLNGYSNEEMCIMFDSAEIPSNIVFEEDFLKLMESLRETV